MLGKFIALSKAGKKFKFELKKDGVALYNGERLNVSIEEEDGFMYLIYKRRKFAIEIGEKNQNKYQIVINGVAYQFSIETPISFRRKKFLQKKHKDIGFEPLLAPMPGKIIEILVEEDAEVKEGDPLLILEAMKMQNEITAQRAGKVIKINVRAGDSVMKDDILVELGN